MVVSTKTVSFTGLEPVGISDFGDERLPRAFMLPIEGRLRAVAGGRQYHFWVRESFVLGDSPRQRAAEHQWSLPDEWAFGLGATLAAGKRQPFYFQLSVEDRVDSVAKVISFGGAFGSF